MAGKCPECPEEGLPEWIMSYADMITILMAFFVVMYSMSSGNKDEEKAAAVMHSLRVWLGGFPADWPIPMNGGHNKRGDHADDGAQEGPPPRPAVSRADARDNLAAGTSIYFDAEKPLSEQQRRHLATTAEVLAGKRHAVEIRVQASPRPLASGSGYPDKLACAYEHAREVLEYLATLGIERERVQLRVVGAPVAGRDRDDPLLRQHDGRIDLYLLDDFLDERATGPGAVAPGTGSESGP